MLAAMSPRRPYEFAFLNAGHAYTHFFLLIYPTVVLALERDWEATYAALIGLAVWGFVAFALATLPAGWLGDRWSRRGMMTVFFVGIGAAAILTGLAEGPVQLAGGLALIGLFAAIYHPVGIAMVADAAPGRLGRALGVNGVFGNLGVALAALTAGVLTDAFGWRAAFIAPGAVAVLTGIGWVLLPRRPAVAHGTASRPNLSLDRATQVRVFVVLVVATLAGGLIFNATTIALPKVIAERVALAGSLTGIGGLVSLVFGFAAVAQIVVGHLIDRVALRTVFVGVVIFQIPLLALAASATGPTMLAVSLATMLLVFGEIPVHDTIVARCVTPAWRARVYAVKYVLSLGVSAAVVPLIAWLHAGRGGFEALFWVLAALALAVLFAAIAFPAAVGRVAQPVPA